MLRWARAPVRFDLALIWRPLAIGRERIALPRKTALPSRTARYLA
jgi:hypothetical protein